MLQWSTYWLNPHIWIHFHVKHLRSSSLRTAAPTGHTWRRTGGAQDGSRHPSGVCSSHTSHTAPAKLLFCFIHLSLSAALPKISLVQPPPPHGLLPDHTVSTLSPGSLGSFAEALGATACCRSRRGTNQPLASLQRLLGGLIHYLQPTWCTCCSTETSPASPHLPPLPRPPFLPSLQGLKPPPPSVTTIQSCAAVTSKQSGRLPSFYM